MITLETHGNNNNVIINGKYEVLFSYSTPVACHDLINHGFYKTEKKWSKTTSKHINSFIGAAPCEVKPQDFFDMILVKMLLG